MGLLDLISARNPGEARQTLADLVRGPQNRLRGLLDSPVSFLTDALNDVVPTGQQAAEQLQRYQLPMSQDYAMGPSGYDNKLRDMALAGIVKNPTVEKAARQHFGITRSPSETGYLLDDATRLDLSGRHYATGYQSTPSGYAPKPGQPDYLRNSRNVDHRELGDLVSGDGGWERLSAFMDSTGAVRYMPDTGISMVSTNKPSFQQIQKAVSDFRSSGQPLNVDIDAFSGGSNIASKEFTRPNAEAVYKWIEEQYAKVK